MIHQGLNPNMPRHSIKIKGVRLIVVVQLYSKDGEQNQLRIGSNFLAKIGKNPHQVTEIMNVRCLAVVCNDPCLESLLDRLLNMKSPARLRSWRSFQQLSGLQIAQSNSQKGLRLSGRH